MDKSLEAAGYCSRKCELEAIKSSERSVRSRSTVEREISRREREKRWKNLSQRATGCNSQRPRYSHRGNLSTDIQQRAAKTASPASVDGGQVAVGGAG